MTTLLTHLVSVSDAYAQAKGLARATVSSTVLARGATLDRLAEGKADVTTGTFEKAMSWFSANWPDSAEWPADVPRPSPATSSRRAEQAGAEPPPSAPAAPFGGVVP